MQQDSSISNKSDENKSNKQLNVNAPVFEPKQKIINPNSSDPVWGKLSLPGNIKSTILVPPHRQQCINTSNNYTYSPYCLPTNNQYQWKIDYSANPNGATIIYPINPAYDSMISTNQQTQNVSDSHPASTNVGTDNTLSSSEKNEVSNTSQISKTHSSVDYQSQSQTATQPLAIDVSHPAIIPPPSNIYQMGWPNCSQSPSIALLPTNYYGPNNFCFFRPQLLYSPYVMPQNKSATKMSIKSKTFNTGDPDLDRKLNELVKRINPVEEFVFRSNNSRFFVIKSFTEDNIYQSIRHSVWCSTPAGNDSLVAAFKQVKSREIPNDETTKPHVYLFFSVNGSGYFCGVAEMTSELHPANSSVIWNQKKWQNQFSVNWLYIKDVPNSFLRQIKLENNDNRPVTNCRDATEILPMEKGIEVLKIIHNIHYDSYLLNDFNEK